MIEPKRQPERIFRAEPSLSHAYFALINEILTGHMNDDKTLLKKWKWLNLRSFPQVVMTAGFIYTQTEDFDLRRLRNQLSNPGHRMAYCL